MDAAIDILLEHECEMFLRGLGYHFDKHNQPYIVGYNLPELVGEWTIQTVYDFHPEDKHFNPQRQIYNIAVPIKMSFLKMYHEYLGMIKTK